jgi:transcriptional regulator with XRE-family HTH domain/quercetin dioxygenase-like cupin family protein
VVGQPVVPAIGARIRAERQRRGVSVRGLARDIGVSASLISQVENDKNLPSVSTLYAITTALDIPIEDLFEAEPSALPVPQAAGDGAAPVVRVAGPDRDRGVGPHVHPGEREVLKLDSGVTWERLGQMPGTHVDFLLITYQPGGTSSSSGELMRHSGTEYGYLVSGQLTLTLGFDQHRLGVGDAVCFDSTIPHGYRNDGTEPAVGVWFVLERT